MDGWVHDVLLFLTALLAAYAAWRGRQNGQGIETVKRQTDGLLSQVVETTAKSAHLEGVKEGIAAAVQLPPNGPPK